MLNRDYPGQDCSAAYTLGLLGERWTMLVIRDVFAGIRRFDEMQEDLGVARNVLSSRLQRLVDEGILERRAYSERPPRHEYFLTEKGIDLWPILITMMRWGDRYGEWPDGPPLVIIHKQCWGEMDDHFTCERCGERLGPRDVVAAPGPGATPRVIERAERHLARLAAADADAPAASSR
ncbi:MAG TPA: helix-turn-helix domain-containing protein [Solirubrobacterales bacterium]|nr:helix-turn-helix domain-containing protein [Solirubrobacterales bacterium]